MLKKAKLIMKLDVRDSFTAPRRIVYSARGKFQLSKKAEDLYHERHMVDLTEEERAGFKPVDPENNRDSEILVKIVEELGSEASPPDTKLTIFEVPANCTYSMTTAGGNEWPCIYQKTTTCDA